MVGGGSVGLEFAQAYRRFGSRVSIIEPGSRLAGKEDPDIAAAILEMLHEEGVEVHTGAEVLQAEGRSGEAVTLEISTAAGCQTIRGSDVLVATGRLPNTEGIGLDLAEVTLDARGFVAANGSTREQHQDVWAIGDCAGSPQFTHVSLDDFRIIRDNLAGGRRSRKAPEALAGIRRRRGSRVTRSHVSGRLRAARDRAGAAGQRPGPGGGAMADLIFGCTGASADRYAATPTLTFSLTISETSGVRVHAIALRCQIRIEPHRRRYSAAEARRLHDLFGDPSRWANTVKPIELATVTTMVPSFTALTEVDVQVPCTYDLEVASARYLQGLDDGTIPLLLLFSGTVFVDTGAGFSVELVPWSAEASYRMLGERLARPGERALPRERMAALQQRNPGRAVRLQGAARPADLGRHPAGPAGRGDDSRGGRPKAGPSPRRRRTPGRRCGREPRRRPPRRQRGPLRGVHPVSVPRLGGQEPQPLAVRRADAARVHGGRPFGDAPSRRPSASSSTPGGRLADHRPVPAGAAADRPGGRATWDEAVEREIEVVVGPDELLGEGLTSEFTVAGGEDREPLPAQDGAQEYTVRRREPLAGAVRVRSTSLPGPWGAVRLQVRVENRTDPAAAPEHREEALPSALVAAHVIMSISGGEFLSMTDPPIWAKAAVAECRTSAAGPSWPTPTAAGTSCCPRRSSCTTTPSSRRRARASCTTAPRSTRSSPCARWPSPTTRSSRPGRPIRGRPR